MSEGKQVKVSLALYLSWEWGVIWLFIWGKGRDVSGIGPEGWVRWFVHLLVAREFHKNIYFCFIDYAKAFDCVDHHKLWKILKEMGIPDHLICLLRNLYAGQEPTWNKRLVPNWGRNTSRLYIVTLLI